MFFNVSDAQYDETDGLLKLTIGQTHELTIEKSIKIANESLRFTCSKDSYATQHRYPREGDPYYAGVSVAGVASATGTGVEPHTLVDSVGDEIVLFTDPLGILTDKKFEDDDELSGAGDGIPDLLNANTDFEYETNLDGGLASSLYGIEETIGGQNTTLLQVGDSIYDGSPSQLVATVQSAGQLGDGEAHTAIVRSKNQHSSNMNYTIYINNKKKVLELYDRFLSENFPVSYITGDRSSEDRKQIMQQF